jgi:hypothetical protein
VSLQPGKGTPLLDAKGGDCGIAAVEAAGSSRASGKSSWSRGRAKNDTVELREHGTSRTCEHKMAAEGQRGPAHLVRQLDNGAVTGQHYRDRQPPSNLETCHAAC